MQSLLGPVVELSIDFHVAQGCCHRSLGSNIGPCPCRLATELYVATLVEQRLHTWWQCDYVACQSRHITCLSFKVDVLHTILQLAYIAQVAKGTTINVKFNSAITGCKAKALEIEVVALHVGSQFLAMQCHIVTLVNDALSLSGQAGKTAGEA